MLKVQEYLRSVGTLDELAMEFNLDFRRHSRHPLVILDYTNDSPKFEPITRECRGLVLEEGTWEVVGKPMTRFYNYGEHSEETAKFDWTDFKMYEKVDGSFILASPYKGDWIISTRGTFGDFEVNGIGHTWEQLFWQTAPHLTPSALRPDTCYGFELWTEHNAIITRYPKPDVWLLYAYDLETHKEWPEHVYHSEANRLRVRTPQKFNFFDSIDHVRGFLKDLTKEEPSFEGVVLKDRNGIRIKVKTETYLELHQFFGNGAIFSPKRLVPLWLSGDFKKAIERFPAIEDPLCEVGMTLDLEMVKLWHLWLKAKGIEGQKEFAQYILPRTELSAILFDLRKRYLLNPDDVTLDVFSVSWMLWPDLILKKLFPKEQAAA